MRPRRQPLPPSPATFAAVSGSGSEIFRWCGVGHAPGHLAQARPKGLGPLRRPLRISGAAARPQALQHGVERVPALDGTRGTRQLLSTSNGCASHRV